MNDPTDRELLDLLGVKVENKNNPNNSLFEKIISGFEEINNFFEKNNRLPENKLDRNIFERIYSIRLNGCISPRVTRVVSILSITVKVMMRL